MQSRFIRSDEASLEQVPWGRLAWFSRPVDSGAEALAVVEVIFRAGTGHNFHKHPSQEEVIYVLEGEIEQWIGQERRVLAAGDSAVIAPSVVHASFNRGEGRARLLAILGPCVGREGYDVVDVSGEEPWSSVGQVSTGNARER